jgi:predicted nucleic acid-binding Zn ribbon protein
MNAEDEAVREEARSVYLRLRAAFGGAPAGPRSKTRRRRTPDEGESQPYGPGRDPATLGDMLSGLTKTMGWEAQLSQSELIAAWQEIAGPETAAHSEPTGVEDGLLRVKCDSTAWATQLRLMRTEILTRIAQRFPEADIQNIAFSGPGTPNWKRGPRSVPGRGPRDTYG